MTSPIHICFRGVDESEAVYARILAEGIRLSATFAQMTGCRVVVQKVVHLQDSAPRCQVTIGLTVPGEELAITRQRECQYTDQNACKVVSDVFEAITLRLHDHIRRNGGSIRRVGSSRPRSLFMRDIQEPKGGAYSPFQKTMMS